MSPALLTISIPLTSPPTVYVPLSPAQRFWYKRLLTRADTITLSEIFTAPAPTLASVAADDEHAEGESQIRENIKQAMAASKAGGEGNAWMKMMNLCVPVLPRPVVESLTLLNVRQSHAAPQVLQPPLPPPQRRVRTVRGRRAHRRRLEQARQIGRAHV